MRHVIVALVLVSALAACSQSVDVKKNADGSETVTVKTPGGTTTTTTNNTSDTHLDDGKGNTMDAKTNADGTTSISGTSADGKSYSQTTGKDVDLTLFGLKPYPHVEKSDNTTTSSLTKADDATIGIVAFTTADSTKDVMAFYAPMITSDKTEATTPSGSVLNGKTSNKSTVAIAITDQDSKRQVTITATTK